MSLDAAPIPVTHLLWPQLGNRDSIPPSWVIGTFGIEHSGILNPWMPPGRGGTARWLPSPPDPATAIVSLPSQHSMPGKHNPSTEAQLPHCTPSTAALPLSTVPTAFTQLPIKPSNLTRPRAPLSAAHTSHTPSPAPCSPLCLRLAPRTQTLPSRRPTEPLPAQHVPPRPAAAGKALPAPPLTAASAAGPSARPGQTSLETSPWSWEAAGQVGSSPPRHGAAGGGSPPTGPRCYCTSLSLKRHQFGAGEGNHGPGEAAGPQRGVCTWAGGGEGSSFLDPVCFPV